MTTQERTGRIPINGWPLLRREEVPGGGWLKYRKGVPRAGAGALVELLIQRLGVPLGEGVDKAVPVSRERLARLLGVSLRTVFTWLDDGTNTRTNTPAAVMVARMLQLLIFKDMGHPVYRWDHYDWDKQQEGLKDAPKDSDLSARPIVPKL